MSGNEDVSTRSFKGYYKAIWKMDLWADFIEPASLENAKYKAIVAPWHLIGKRETCEALRSYVEGGGTLVVETSFGLFDERFFANPVVPPWGLDEVFGYREKESLMMNPEAPPNPLAASDRIYYEPPISFTAPARVSLKANTFVTPIKVTTATPIATCEGLPVAAMKKVGKGTVYYIGTNLGASITGGSRGGVELLRGIITPLVKAEATAEKLRPRLIPGEKQGLLVVFNESAEDVTEQVVLRSKYRRAKNIHSGEEMAVGEKGLRVTVPYQDAAVFLLD